MNIAPYTLARGAITTIKQLIRDGFDFDLIDAHYYYPDGVAAGMVAQVEQAIRRYSPRNRSESDSRISATASPDS